MKNLVWIASYPKSGNTWVRFMLCNLLFGRQESAATLNNLAPDVHEMGAQIADTTRAGLFKTHFAYSPRLPQAQRTAAALYVIRRPSDVLVSNFYYAQRSSAAAADTPRADFEAYFNEFLLNRGDPRWIKLGMGSWDENVRSWLGARGAFPVVTVKYEDMKADPRGTCEKFAKLARPQSTAEEIDAAVANSSFARMQAVEEADIRERRIGIFYKPYLQNSIDSGRRFMRSGAVGDGNLLLDSEQRERLRRAFEPLLSELGYEDA